MQVDAITHVLRSVRISNSGRFLTSVMISTFSTWLIFISKFSFQLQTSVLMFNCLHLFVSGNSQALALELDRRREIGPDQGATMN